MQCNLLIYYAFLGMMIASFARLGLAFANWLGLTNGLALAGRFFLANRFGLTHGLSLAGRLSLFGGLAFTDMPGCFNILMMVKVLGIVDVITFADKIGLIVITIAITVRNHMGRRHITATKLVRRCAC